MKQENRLFTTIQLNENDVEVLQKVVRQFHERTISRRHAEKFLRNASNIVLVGQKNDVIVGFLMAHHLDSLERESSALFIYEIEVDETHRRRGIGSALIRHIRQIAAEKDCFECYVFTNHSNAEAVAFYESTGANIEEGDELMFVYQPTSTRS